MGRHRQSYNTGPGRFSDSEKTNLSQIRVQTLILKWQLKTEAVDLRQ